MKNLKHICSLIVISLSFAPMVMADVEPKVVNIYDDTDEFSFGVLARIPIDTSYITSPICSLLISYGADSVVKCFPTYDPADTTFLRPDGVLARLIDLSRHTAVYFADSVDWLAFRSDYQEIELHVSVSPFPIAQFDNEPTDLLTANQPYLFSDPTVGNRINATDAWDVTTGDSSQIIAVLDGGIDATHEEFLGRIIGGSPAASWDTAHQHGTAVAAILLANTNNTNGFGMAGMNWNAKLYMYNSPSALGWDEDIYSAYQQVGADIISMSLSARREQHTLANHTAVRDAIYNAWVTDVIIVSSKSNAGINTSDSGKFRIPCDYSTVVGVGSVDASGNRSSFSNYGNDIRLMAPGENVYFPLVGGNYLGGFDGTSAAQPIVAGALSLIQAAKPSLYADEVEQFANITARDVELPGIGYDEKTGYGIVDAGAAVRAAAKWGTIRKHITRTDMSPTTQAVRSLTFTNASGSASNLKSGLYQTVQGVFWEYEEDFDIPFGHTPWVFIRHRSTNGWEIDLTAPSNDSVSRFPAVQVTVDDVNQKIKLLTGSYTITEQVGDPPGSDGHWPCKTGSGCSLPTIDIYYTIVYCRQAGDADNDCSVNMTDVNYMIARIFSGGPNFPILNDADVNADCRFNIADVTYLFTYILNGGAAPLDADCSPGSFKPAVGDESFAFAEDVSLKVGAMDRGIRRLKYDGSRRVNALAIRLRALNGSRIGVTKVIDKSELYWSQDGSEVMIGFFDIQGQDFILASDSDLVEISGDFEIVSVEATDILADGKTEYLRPQYVAGKFTAGGAASVGAFSLDGAYPNPFNPVTQIAFSLPVASEVKIEIYNVLGQRVITLTEQKFEAGKHSVRWNSQDENGSTVASGMYFAKMTAGEFSASKKLVILK